MDRFEFRTNFDCSHAVVLPVIHVLDAGQTIENIKKASGAGCPGVFLINHDFGVDPFLPIIHEARNSFPDFWLGLNFLAVIGAKAFPVLSELEAAGCRIDGYWADDARIDESAAIASQPEAQEILGVKERAGWNGLYFGGTAFKKQREVAAADYARSAEIACEYMDVVTTSGVATGKAADTKKIETFRQACGDKPIALASGITPENVHLYSDLVDCLMVATGINKEGDFYNIDTVRLNDLLRRLRG